MRFLNEVLGVGQGEILTCFRAGARRTNADPNKPRPLVCSLNLRLLTMLSTGSTDGGKGWRVENPEDKTKPYWINRDLCAADADAGFRARKAVARFHQRFFLCIWVMRARTTRKAAELKRDQRREAEGQQQKLC